MDEETRKIRAEGWSATMTKKQWLAVVDLIYDAIPRGPDTLLEYLDRQMQGKGDFEPWRKWAEERWMERFGRKPY